MSDLSRRSFLQLLAGLGVTAATAPALQAVEELVSLTGTAANKFGSDIIIQNPYGPGHLVSMWAKPAGWPWSWQRLVAPPQAQGTYRFFDDGTVALIRTERYSKEVLSAQGGEKVMFPGPMDNPLGISTGPDPIMVAFMSVEENGARSFEWDSYSYLKRRNSWKPETELMPWHE